MVEKYCTFCQTILNEDNKYEKSWTNGEKICKDCKLNKFCLYCEENISKISYTKLNIGKVCLNCYKQKYCAVCKLNINTKNKNPVEGKDYVYK